MEHNETEEDLSDSLISVSLSGGGHRASLFGLGVLLALVDLRLNKHVKQLSSVSGGSITNGFVAALPADFCDYTSEAFYRDVRPLVTAIVKKGLLTPAIIAGTILLAASPLLAAWAASEWWLRGLGDASIWISWLALAFGVATTLWFVLNRGWVLETLLARRLFSLSGCGSCNSVRFSDLTVTKVEHVFCCTDLASGQPFYFSTWSSGLLFLRRIPSFVTECYGHAHEQLHCGAVTIAAAVRASAAIPPWVPPLVLSLFKLHSQSRASETAGAAARPTTDYVVLSDGGVWNNLGTQYLIEDRLFQGKPMAQSDKTDKEVEDERRRLWPDLPRTRPNLLLVANASASDQPVSPWHFRVPLWAEVRASLRAVWIGNVNTVEPRASSARERLKQRIASGPALSSDVLTIVVDIWKNARDVHWSISGGSGAPYMFDLNHLDPPSQDVKIGTNLKRVREVSANALLARAYANTLVAFGSLGNNSVTDVAEIKKRLNFLTDENSEWP